MLCTGFSRRESPRGLDYAGPDVPTRRALVRRPLSAVRLLHPSGPRQPSGRRAAGEGTPPLAALHHRLAGGVGAVAGRAADDHDRQAGAAAAALRAGLAPPRAGAGVQQDARAAPGRGEHHHARPLYGAALRFVSPHRAQRVVRRRAQTAGLEAEVHRVEQRAGHVDDGALLRRSAQKWRPLGTAGGERGGRALPQPRAGAFDLLLAGGQRRGGLRGGARARRGWRRSGRGTRR